MLKNSSSLSLARKAIGHAAKETQLGCMEN